MTSYNYDPVGKVLLDLRDDEAVKALVGKRVRSPEPAPPTLDPTTHKVLQPGDARGPGSYIAFVVLSLLATPRLKRAPVQFPRISARCYGATPQQAMDLYTACSNAVHHAGARIYGNGLGVWDSFDDTGGTPGKDPDTQQPYVDFIMELAATTVSVGA